MIQAVDPVAMAVALIRCRSVTPRDDGAQALLAGWLEAGGFTVHRLRFGEVENLFAHVGQGAPHLCFAGHTDVVPPGATGWSVPPFEAEIRDGVLLGRGACDMKGGVAAFTAACLRHAAGGMPAGTLSLLITGDEEGEATDGTARVLDWLRSDWMGPGRPVPDFCVVGEPSNPSFLGEMIKIGRRGSLNATLTIYGVQGHAAYPQRADNPVHRMVSVLAALVADRLDEGSAAFEPSGLQVTSIDTGNPASNVIPACCTVKFNIRFNDLHDGAALEARLRRMIASMAATFELTVTVSGEAFLTAPGPGVETLCAAITQATGHVPRRDTGGGTSDARFIARLCPVAEFGLVGASMHKADEGVAVDDLRALCSIYEDVIARFLPRAGVEARR